MLNGNPKEVGIGVRLHEYFAVNLTWHRRLWGVGTQLALAELDELIELRDRSEQGTAAIDRLHASVVSHIRHDAGVGDSKRRGAVLKQLTTGKLTLHSPMHYAVKSLVADLQANYLMRWNTAIHSASPVSVERAARCIAAHLLDVGFSRHKLFEWLEAKLQRAAPACFLTDVLEDAHTMATAPLTTYNALACFSAAPRSTTTTASTWRSGSAVASWLRTRKFKTRHLRVVGGLEFRLAARDEFAAADRARSLAERIRARASVGDRAALQMHDEIWIDGIARPIKRAHDARGVEVHFLGRQDRLYSEDIPGELDNALELLGVMNSATAGPAATAGWAAVESLLKCHGYPTTNVSELAGAILAAAFPRGELTQLAYAHESATDDTLAQSLKQASSNRDRARRVLEHLAAGRPLVLEAERDKLAANRLVRMLQKPEASLRELRDYAQCTFDRLYRLRNLVSHAGRTDAVALVHGLRTAAPLVGALADRIVDAALTSHVAPVQLAARTNLNLELVGMAGGPGIHELLD